MGGKREVAVERASALGEGPERPFPSARGFTSANAISGLWGLPGLPRPGRNGAGRHAPRRRDRTHPRSRPPRGGLRRRRAPAQRPSPAPLGSACAGGAGCGDAPGRQPPPDRATAPSGRGQRLPASRARAGWEGPGDAGWRGPGGPGGAVEGRAGGGGYLCGGGGARRLTGGDGGLLPTAGLRSPVGLGRGPPSGVPRRRLRVLPTSGPGLGVRAVLFAHLPPSCRRRRPR